MNQRLLNMLVNKLMDIIIIFGSLWAAVDKIYMQIL